MSISRLPVFLFAILALQACGTYSLSSTTPSNNGINQLAHAKKSPQQIIITENDMPDRKYVSLGDISVTVRKTTIFDKDPTRALVVDALREKAADMGADAVVLVRYGTVGVGLFSWGQLDGSGRVVVFQ